MGSIQCRKDVLLSRPTGAEITAANATRNIDLQAGRVVRVDHPDAGVWRIRLSGNGLFLLSVVAKTTIALSDVTFSPGAVDARLAGEVSGLKLQLVDASGAPLSPAQPLDATEGGTYRAAIARPAQRLRVLVTGTDPAAVPFQRMYPNLFQAEQAK